ncbi:MAG: hypothetical protein IRY99_26155 [Isosphaeraceae bacterium]|nr:hypothetical protein [Isosphaeraceae bacterium]
MVDRPRFQLSVAGMLMFVACVALNIWLFRLGPLMGILGLNISKHVLIAYLCQILGVNKSPAEGVSMPAIPAEPSRVSSAS